MSVAGGRRGPFNLTNPDRFSESQISFGSPTVLFVRMGREGRRDRVGWGVDRRPGQSGVRIPRPIVHL